MVRSVDWPAFTEVQTDVYGHNTSVWETVALFTFTTYLEHLLVIFVTMALLNFFRYSEIDIIYVANKTKNQQVEDEIYQFTPESISTQKVNKLFLEI